MNQQRRIVLLGATGSIGRTVQKVVRSLPERLRIVGISANRDAEGLLAAAEEFRPVAVCAGECAGRISNTRLPAGVRLLRGQQGLVELATLPEADIVLVSIVGTAGLAPALAAIRAGKDLAIASKEILVMAGSIVMREAALHGVKILPVDSEHNAIFQCLEGKVGQPIRRLLLTCSGGPFRQMPVCEFEHVTPEMALQHPTWQMGKKITVDSATLFNKGLEMIEAHWLFGVEMARIEVVIHPQSIIHSMVEFADGSILAQMSHTDMAFPIQYALTYPERVAGILPPLDFAKLGKLEFDIPREADFPALRLAREAGTRGGTFPAALNAANEVAVEAFLQNRIRFPAIWEIVEAVLEKVEPVLSPELGEILRADARARQLAEELIAGSPGVTSPK
ncbi:MAG: 1-deoxy-D-xylulose-5-phosphate reductoisomerase [Chthoniobacterales bacterium]|nr:1-deoxy-D-xylulose-5-phosphate reductoisomerase [Chthoniobacterales bacterium]